jgi:hypothetical protein
MNPVIAVCLFTVAFTVCAAVAFPEIIATVWNSIVPPFVDYLLRKAVAIADLFSYGAVITRPMQITKSGRRYVESKEFVLAFGEAFSKLSSSDVPMKTKSMTLTYMITWAAIGGNLKKLPDASDTVDLNKFIVDHWAEVEPLLDKFQENMQSLDESDLLDENGLLPDWCY